MCRKRNGWLWEGYLVLAGTSPVSIDSDSSSDQILDILLELHPFLPPMVFWVRAEGEYGWSMGEPARAELAFVCFPLCKYPNGNLMWIGEQSPEGTYFIVTWQILKVQSFYSENTWVDFIVPHRWLIKKYVCNKIPTKWKNAMLIIKTNVGRKCVYIFVCVELCIYVCIMKIDQGHAGSKWTSQDLNPCSLILESTVLTKTQDSLFFLDLHLEGIKRMPYCSFLYTFPGKC